MRPFRPPGPGRDVRGRLRWRHGGRLQCRAEGVFGHVVVLGGGAAAEWVEGVLEGGGGAVDVFGGGGRGGGGGDVGKVGEEGGRGGLRLGRRTGLGGFRWR